MEVWILPSILKYKLVIPEYSPCNEGIQNIQVLHGPRMYAA